MLNDEQRKARNKRKAQRRKLKQKSGSPVVDLDAFRRLRFEAELRECVRPFRSAVASPEAFKAIRRTVKRVIARYARSKSIARLVAVVVNYDEHSETLAIGYWKDGQEINVYDVYDAINPGSKKIVGMHVGTDGSRRPVMQGEHKPDTT